MTTPPRRAAPDTGRAQRNAMLIGGVIGLVMLAVVAFLIVYRATRPQPAPPAIATSGGTTSAEPTAPSPSGEMSASSEPTVSNQQSSSASSDGSPSGGVSQSPGVKPAATGVTEKVLTLLANEGFTCTDEGRPFVSQMCVHYGQQPAMSVYVGGFPGGKLGRVGVSVQGTGEPAEASRISNALIDLMAGKDAATVKNRIKQGTADKLAEGRVSSFDFRGRSDGSVIMHDPSFPGGEAELKPVVVPQAALKQWSEARGFTCKAEAGGQNCELTKTDHQVILRSTPIDPTKPTAQMRVSLEVRAETASASSAVLKTHAQALFKNLGEGGQAALETYQSAPRDGATEFRQGYLIDYFPASTSEQQGTFAAGGGLYILASCWADLYDFC